MSDIDKKKKELLSKINQKEKQLEISSMESAAWDRGKYKKHSNAEISKIFVKSLRKEISDLYKELEKLSGDDT